MTFAKIACTRPLVHVLRACNLIGLNVYLIIDYDRIQCQIPNRKSTLHYSAAICNLLVSDNGSMALASHGLLHCACDCIVIGSQSQLHCHGTSESQIARLAGHFVHHAAYDVILATYVGSCSSNRAIQLVSCLCRCWLGRGPKEAHFRRCWLPWSQNHLGRPNCRDNLIAIIQEEGLHAVGVYSAR